MLRYFASLFVIFLMLPGCAISGTFAVLVGVSDYAEGTGWADLRGPANDVRLMRDVLADRGVAEITLLADGIEGATPPTRAAILGALDELVRRTQPGDFALIFMAGHGGRQPDGNGDESDGFDEVFVPMDVGRTDQGTGIMPNAIVDEELGARVTALRAKGVDVWFVLDSCHSGSGLRSGSARVAQRTADPAALGVRLPAPRRTAAPAVDLGGASDDALPGRYLAFYAAMPSEAAVEILLDENSPDSWYGLFTSRLAARLRTDLGASYRQLFQAVLGDLNASTVPGVTQVQTPLWEGNLIDAAVFGGSVTLGLRQYEVSRGRLLAGSLHGLRDNAVVALVADAAAAEDDILGFAQLTRTEPQRARLAAVGGDCVARAEAPCAGRGTLPQEARFARLVAQPVSQSVGIAPPVDLTTGAALADDDPALVALRDAIAKANGELGTNLVLAVDGPVRTGLHDGALWFGPRLSVGGLPMGLRWSPQADGPLAPLLQRISKAEEMAQMLGNVAASGSVLFGSPVVIEAQMQAGDPTALAPALPAGADGAWLGEECGVALQGTGTEVRAFTSGTDVKQCDMVGFTGRGKPPGSGAGADGPKAHDVNRVYVDSQYCLFASYKRIEGFAQTVPVGDAMQFCSDCPMPEGGIVDRAGVNRAFFVVTQAQPGQEALNLESHVANCGAPQSPETTRQGHAPRAAAFLATLAGRDATRSGLGSLGPKDIWVEDYTWQVLPRAVAIQAARN